MALITCPECQQQISDQATACPNCGYPLQKATASASDPPSPPPFVNSASNGANVSVSDAPIGVKRPKPLAIGIASIVFIVLIAVIAVFVNKSNKEREAMAARTEYIENLHLFATTALSGGADAENACNLTKSVWYDTIHEEYDAKTAPYTQTNGIFHDDFNTSLSVLYSSSEMTDIVSAIEDNQEEVDGLYKKLLNPTSEFEKCFDEVESIYSIYYKFTNLAVSPSGSLNTYSENFAAYDNDFIEHYNKLLLLIPEE